MTDATLTRPEFYGILAVVVVIVVGLAVLAWRVARSPIEPWEPMGEPGDHLVIYEGERLQGALSPVDQPKVHPGGLYAVYPGEPWSVAGQRIRRELAAGETPPAFRWPPGRADRSEPCSGPVRGSFRRYLEGGPDYRG
jgi:hypothetical protein